MKMTLKIILYVWLAFDALVYLYIWLDVLYYKYNFPRVFKNVKEALTEEE